jgi:hypothetical protein
MASFRAVVTLVLALTLCFAATAAAQAIGPICLEVALAEGEGEPGIIEIFALPLGGTTDASQFLLSAVSGIAPLSGAARLVGQRATFTLMAAFPFPSAGIGGTFAGLVDLETGTGQGTCSTIDSPGMTTCGTNTLVTYRLVSCDDA